MLVFSKFRLRVNDSRTTGIRVFANAQWMCSAAASWLQAIKQISMASGCSEVITASNVTTACMTCTRRLLPCLSSLQCSSRWRWFGSFVLHTAPSLVRDTILLCAVHATANLPTLRLCLADGDQSASAPALEHFISTRVSVRHHASVVWQCSVEY